MLLFGLLLRLSKTQYYGGGRICIIIAVLWGLQLVESSNALERVNYDITRIGSGMVTKTSCSVHGRRMTQQQKAWKFPYFRISAMAMDMVVATTAPLIHLEDLDRKKLQVRCGTYVYPHLVCILTPRFL